MRALHPMISKTARAAAVALALGATAVTAMPAQAGSSFSFGFGVGPGYDMGPGFYPYRHHFRPFPDFVCLTDFQVRLAIRNAGYFNVYLNAPMGRYIQARASRGNSTFLITFDRCRGVIVRVERLRHDHPRPYGGGFPMPYSGGYGGMGGY